MASGIHLSQVGGLSIPPTKVTSFINEDQFEFECPASTACNWFYFGQQITVNMSESIYGNPAQDGPPMQHMSGWIQAGGWVTASGGYGHICTIYHYNVASQSGMANDSGGVTLTF
jgi:hypothetical protein